MAAFYSVCATASAALIGLLFAAVQLGPPLVPTGPLGRRHAIARSTFTIFAVIFGLSLYMLAPGPSLENHVIAAIVAATAARSGRSERGSRSGATSCKAAWSFDCCKQRGCSSARCSRMRTS
jgi:hypothetical protein